MPLIDPATVKDWWTPLVVCDVNETLAAKVWNTDFTVVKHTLLPRCDDLLQMARQGRILLMFWSGAWRTTVDAFLQECVPDDVPYLAAWCKDDGEPDLEFPNMKTSSTGELRNIAVIKNLDKVWAAFPNINRGRTVIFDDDRRKIRMHPQNAILVPKDGTGPAKIVEHIVERFFSDNQ